MSYKDKINEHHKEAVNKEVIRKYNDIVQDDILPYIKTLGFRNVFVTDSFISLYNTVSDAIYFEGNEAKQLVKDGYAFIGKEIPLRKLDKGKEGIIKVSKQPSVFDNVLSWFK